MGAGEIWGGNHPDGTEEGGGFGEGKPEREPLPWREGAELSMREVQEVSRVDGVEPNHGAMAPRELRLRHEVEYLEPMSRARKVDAFADPRTTVGEINPDYESGVSYQVNCADCARCFEATWRGQAQEAAGRAPEAEGTVVEGELSERTEEWAGEDFRDVRPSDLRQVLETGGHGASAVVHTTFVTVDGDVGGHAYNVVNYDGKVEVVDGQTGDVLDYSDDHIMPELGVRTQHVAMAWDVEGRRLW